MNDNGDDYVGNVKVLRLKRLTCSTGATCTSGVPAGQGKLGCAGPDCEIDYSDDGETITCSGQAICDLENDSGIGG